MLDIVQHFFMERENIMRFIKFLMSGIFASCFFLMLSGCAEGWFGTTTGNLAQQIGSNRAVASSMVNTAYLGKAVAFNATTAPKHVTVLLPLSGKFGASGKAVRNGFLTAHYYAKQQGQKVPALNFLDTGTADANSLYQQALANGSDFIVGPLTKNEINALLNSPQLPLPTLALNTVDSDVAKQNTNLYQFGLAPEDEILQVANKIIQDGYKNILVIAPDDARSSYLLSVFNNSFTGLRGKIVAQMIYNKNADFSTEVANLLGVDQQRINQQRKALKKEDFVKIDPATFRRQDFDAIFLLASPDEARQIRPLIKFYYAEKIPVYATSQIYGGVPSPQLDVDLDGIIFCDLPWVLQNPAALPNYISDPQKQIMTIWPNSPPDLVKLYALGIDSYNLMRFINKPGSFPANGLAGATGALFLTSSRHIFRRLDFAVFRDGRPELITQ